MTTLYQIGQWFEDKGLVGEKPLALVNTIVAVSGKPMGFGLEAPAGSGKTVAMDLVVGTEAKDCGIIESKHVYFKDAGSATSFFYDAAEINKKKIVVFKELQKDKTDMTIEAIKSMTEGKVAGRRVTDVTTDSTRRQEIEPKTVMYTLAIENDTKPDTELRRRCITMSTDISREQTADVLELKAKLRWDRNASTIMTAAESAAIKSDVNAILCTKMNIVNPFASEFSKVVAEIAPDQKVRSMIEHFWDVMEGVTKLNSIHRVQYKDDVVCDIQDLAMTLDVYKASFLRDVYSIPPLGDVVLRGFDDATKVKATDKGPASISLAAYGITESAGGWIDINHLRKAIKEEQKIVLSKNVVYNICKQLVDAGYLEDWKDGQTIKYQVMDKFTEFSTPDWNDLVEKAAILVKARYPAKFDTWYKNQSIAYQNPITGELIQILKRRDILDRLSEDII